MSEGRWSKGEEEKGEVERFIGVEVGREEQRSTQVIGGCACGLYPSLVRGL